MKETLMAERILLTGGAGYIGSHTYLALIEAGFQVVVLDDFSNSKASVPQRLARLTGRNTIDIHAGSVRDRGALDRLFGEYDIDAVVHFAAKKAVGESLEDPLSYIATNTGGLLTLLEAMEAAHVRKMVFSSSATVYGDPETLPITEDAVTSFTNPYGFTKLSGEDILRQVSAANDAWSMGILRYFNPVGAHPSGLIGEDPNGIPNNLMPYVAGVASGRFETLTIFGGDYDTPDGTGVRDYIHVMDLARGHVLSLKALLGGQGGHLVNLGRGQGTSVLELVAAYEEACGKTIPYEVGPRRPGDVASLWADVSQAEEILGFRAEHGLKAICESSWNWIETGAGES